MRLFLISTAITLATSAVVFAQSSQALQGSNTTPTCQMLTITNGQAGQINLPGMPARFHSATGSITVKRAGTPAETLSVQATTDPFEGVHAGPFKSIKGQPKSTTNGLKKVILMMTYPPQPNSKVTVRIGGNARNGNMLTTEIMSYTGPVLKISGTINLCVL